MIVVIQCASSKRPDAATLQTADGKRVCFVADPAKAPPSDCLYALPDDPSDQGYTWRERLLSYNHSAEANPLGLCRAFELYRPTIYCGLAEHVGIRCLYILSAGWGLIAASFLTPAYDITFKAGVDAYKRRKKSDTYHDFCMLPPQTDEPVVFFGAIDYLPLFCRLTEHITVPKTVFYRSAQEPDLPSCSLVRYETARRTNWHYECAEAFIQGRLQITG